MWIIVFSVAVCLFAILGLTFLLEGLWLYIMRPKSDPPRTQVLYLKPETAVQQLRAAIEEYRWEGGGRIGVIAAVDCGLGEEEKNSCREIAETHRYVFMDDSTLKNALEKMGCEIP